MPPAEQRLAHYLRWLFWSCLVSLVSYGALAVIFRSEAFTRLTCVVIPFFVTSVIIPRRLLRKGRVEKAALWTAFAFAGVLVAATLAVPQFYIVLLGLSLMPALLGFYYVRGRASSWLIWASIVAAVLVAIIGTYMPAESGLPSTIQNAVNVVFFAVGISNVAMLLGQHNRRLEEVVAERTSELEKCARRGAGCDSSKKCVPCHDEP